MRPRKVRRLLAAVGIGACVAGSGLAIVAPQAKADTGIGCKTDLWGPLFSQRRTICDGAVRADGSWERVRVFWTPAHQVPLTCYGTYFITCNGGYFVSERVNSTERYPVTAATVLPDEPAHLVGVN